MADIHTLNEICGLVTSLFENGKDRGKKLERLGVLVRPFYRRLNDREQLEFERGVALRIKKSGHFCHTDMTGINPLVGLLLSMSAQPSNITTVDFEKVDAQLERSYQGRERVRPEVRPLARPVITKETALALRTAVCQRRVA